ncbi:MULTISPECIES: hypothetical protein [unclassified Archaeoglobus]|uniref:hypothetical protein n=1 Tax=unclassified Archaeoglobus TaxID=2643606 RepID=UPI0025C2A871|nr:MULTISPECIES: hypothetical protein [unclassified Archaeoglobus]
MTTYLEFRGGVEKVDQKRGGDERQVVLKTTVMFVVPAKDIAPLPFETYLFQGSDHRPCKYHL